MTHACIARMHRAPLPLWRRAALAAAGLGTNDGVSGGSLPRRMMQISVFIVGIYFLKVYEHLPAEQNVQMGAFWLWMVLQAGTAW